MILFFVFQSLFYLTDRQQRVVLNGETSNWQNVSADVPQRSVLSSLLFLIYDNDLPEELNAEIKLSADRVTTGAGKAGIIVILRNQAGKAGKQVHFSVWKAGKAGISKMFN